MEYFDVVDSRGMPTGETVERTKAHREGIMHRTSHVWLLKKDNGKIWVLLQRRSANKDSYPLCYDISSAGHIPAGKEFAESAIRELKEELGVEAREEELIFCGDRIVEADDCFRGVPYHDRQYSRVFLKWMPAGPDKFTLQEEEVESVMWTELDTCLENVKTGAIKSCISAFELEMLIKAAGK